MRFGEGNFFFENTDMSQQGSSFFFFFFFLCVCVLKILICLNKAQYTCIFESRTNEIGKTNQRATVFLKMRYIRLIRGKMYAKTEQCATIKFCCRLGKSAENFFLLNGWKE